MFIPTGKEGKEAGGVWNKVPSVRFLAQGNPTAINPPGLFSQGREVALSPEGKRGLV